MNDPNTGTHTGRFSCGAPNLTGLDPVELKPIEFDVETTGFQAYSGVHYAFSYQFYDGERGEFILYDPDDDSPENQEAAARIQEWFDRSCGRGLRAWNSKFDFHFAMQAGFTLPPEEDWHDGMLEAHAINERRSVALKMVHEELFGKDENDSYKVIKAWMNSENKRRRDEAKANGTEYEPANYSDIPLELIETYGMDDVYKTRRVCDSHEIVFENKPDLKRVVEFERKSLASIFWIERRGLPARRDEYLKLKYEVAENLERLHERVLELAMEGDPVKFAKALSNNWSKDDGDYVTVSEDGRVVSYGGKAKLLSDFNPNSSAQVLAALKARGADMQYMSEKDGKVPADADNLRAVEDELAVAILDFRAEAKVLSTYVEPMIQRKYDSATNSYKQPFIGPDSRIHANYRQVGARTGRMSCSDPNIQNQPRDDLRLRYNIVADEGMALVCCDLSNIEMFLFTAYCGPGRLWKALENGDDLHQLCADMLGFRDRQRPGGGYESARQQGKVYNFTTIYGGGLRSIKRYFRVNMDTARQYKQRYAKAFPEVTNLQNRISWAVAERGYLQDTLISGRRFRVSRDEAYKGVNYIVQGTAAALLKHAVNELHKLGVPMVALIHDEIVAHVPIHEAQEVKNLMIETMTHHPELNAQFPIPLKADGDIVKRWSDAKPIKDDKGRLYYFDPKWANVPRRYVDETPALVAA